MPQLQGPHEAPRDRHAAREHRPPNPLADFVRLATRNAPAPPAVSFASFWYDAGRGPTFGAPTSVMELQNLPLHSGASVLQWVQNQRYRAAVAYKRDETALAEQHEREVARLETIMSEIIDARVQLRDRDRPIGVDILIDGRVREPGQLPDGFKGLFSVLGDLLLRLDRVKWVDDVPVTDREFVLLWDEVELHLHPAWQRKAVDALQRLFRKAQFIMSTHSPFVVNSSVDAWIHVFELRGDRATVVEALPSQAGMSAATVVRDVLGIPSEFGPEADHLLQALAQARNDWLRGEGPAKERFEDVAKKLAALGPETGRIAALERQQVERRLAKPA